MQSLRFCSNDLLLMLLLYNKYMQKLKAGIRKLAYRVQHNFLSLNNIVEVIALVICLWFAFGTINAMSRNWQLKQKLQDRKIEQARLEIEVEKLKLEQQYYNTEEYRELLARSKGGKMAEGETMVVLPRNSEEAINKHNDDDVAIVTRKSNFEQWMDLLFR